MCVSAGESELRGAVAYGGEVTDELHVFAYYFEAMASLSGPNCVLFHIPTAELTEWNLVPCGHAPNFMRDMGKAVDPLSERRSRASKGFTFGTPEPIVVSYGPFEMVLANSATDIPRALGRVSESKRPDVSRGQLEFWDRERPLCSFGLACFNNAVEVASQPILMRYQPLDPTKLFVPGLESHTGEPPVLGSRGQRGIKVVMGSMQQTKAGQSTFVDYADYLGELGRYLPRQVVGFHDQGEGVNDDYVVDVDLVRQGVSGSNLFRAMPAQAGGRW